MFMVGEPRWRITVLCGPLGLKLTPASRVVPCVAFRMDVIHVIWIHMALDKKQCDVIIWYKML